MQKRTESMNVEVTIQEFSIIIEALDKYHATMKEDSDGANRLSDLINKLDRQGLKELGFEISEGDPS